MSEGRCGLRQGARARLACELSSGHAGAEHVARDARGAQRRWRVARRVADGAGEGLGWWREARCAQADPDAFFPVLGGPGHGGPGGGPGDGRELGVADTRAICRRCPVRDQCLDHALREGERDGIWGGMTPSQRRREARRRELATIEGVVA